MSKVDAMRALKDARLAEQRKAVVAAGGSRPSTPRAAAPVATAAAPAAQPDGLCGHRNMGGRSCTRPSGHEEKSHRYG